MGFGENVKRIMGEMGIKQNELARKIGMSSSGICSALAPDGNPRENTIRAIADALDCKIGELMDDPDDSLNTPIDKGEEILLVLFRQLNDYGQTTVLNITNEMLRNPGMRKEESMSSMG